MEKDKEIDENKNLSPKQRKLIFVYFAWFFMCILMALPFFTRSCISKNELNEEAAVEIKAGTEELNKKKFVCCKVIEVINKVEDNKFLKANTEKKEANKKAPSKICFRGGFFYLLLLGS